jgi:AraC family transcriptional regulator
LSTRGALWGGLLLATLAMASGLIGGCAGQKGMAENWWGDPATGITMEYRMPEGKTLTYLSTHEQTQSMEVMGQTTDIEFDQSLTFTVAPGAMGDQGQELDVTIDSFEITMSTPQGTMSPATDHLTGKGFAMALDAKGKESGCENADGLTYVVPQSGEQSLSGQFCEFFNELPEGMVKVGDTWESNVTVNEGGPDADVRIDITSMNTLSGFELVGGYDCARVESEFDGTVKGTGAQGPATFVMTGTIEGSGTWHFAYKEGILVSDFSMGTSDGEITVQGPQEMVIPTSREFVMESKLLAPGEESMPSGKPAPQDKMGLKPVDETTMTPGKITPVVEHPEPEIVTAGGFTVAGVRHRFESMDEATPEAFDDIWSNRFEAHHDVLLDRSTDKLYYGVSYATGEGDSFYYLAGMPVADESDLPEGIESTHVPEGQFAVFKTKLSGISKTWQYAFETWLPTSGYAYDWSAPSYEEYPGDTDDESEILIYVPVAGVK